MSVSRLVLSLALAGALLGGCAKPISQQAGLTAMRADAITTSATAMSMPALLEQPMPEEIFIARTVPMRTLAVGTTADIVLRPREVVLTFDDGPRPGKTPAILDALDSAGVKATFLMLGSAAAAHPELARTVALRGHTVGSHTYGHVDLSTLPRQEAIAEIVRGEEAVVSALAGSGQTLSPFFRFPYLSQTGFLRTNLLHSGAVVLDVDIDSKDYYDDTPEVVAERTLSRLEAQGSGIVLFHDIHQRTVDMLPGFLQQLALRGYTVVRLVPKDTGVFGRDLITAGVADDDETL